MDLDEWITAETELDFFEKDLRGFSLSAAKTSASSSGLNGCKALRLKLNLGGNTDDLVVLFI